MPGQQSSAALLPSLFTFLAVVVCPHLLSLVAGYCWIAQFFLHSFLDYRLTPRKKEKKKEKRSSFLHCFFSLGLWRNFTPHRLIFSCLRHCYDLPQPWALSSWAFYISFIHFYSQTVPRFFSPFSPLTFISWEILLAETNVIFIGNIIHCIKWFLLCELFCFKIPFVSSWQLCLSCS